MGAAGLSPGIMKITMLGAAIGPGCWGWGRGDSKPGEHLTMCHTSGWVGFSPYSCLEVTG